MAMGFVNNSAVKKLVHEKGKLIQKDALAVLERKVTAMIENAITNTRQFKTIRPLDIETASTAKPTQTAPSVAPQE